MASATIQFNPITEKENPNPTTITITKTSCFIYGITENSPGLLWGGETTAATINVDFGLPEYYYITAQIISYKINGVEYDVPNNVNIELVNVFSKSDTIITMSPAQTPLVAYAFHQFISYDNLTQNGDFIISGTDRQMGLAMGMKLNFMNSKGDLSKVISRSPNAFQTNSWALWGSLSNLLVNAINPNTSNYASFLADNNATGTSYFQAFYNLVENPFLDYENGETNPNAKPYDLGVGQPVYYIPNLQNLALPEQESPIPDNWNLAIKVHSSGADNFIIAGAAYIVFDKNDRGWLTTNVMAGTPNSSTFCVVLEPNGAPAEFSPVVGGGLLGVGFGVATDAKKENVFFGNFGWGPTQCNPHEGSISRFGLDGNPISPSKGYTKGTSRVQGLNFDNAGNLWVTSWGSQEPFAPADVVYPFKNKPSSIVVYLVDSEGELDYDNPIVKHLSDDDNPYLATFDVARNPKNGDMYVSCAGTNHKGLSGVYRCSLENGEVVITDSWNHTTDPANAAEFEGLRQVNFDNAGNVYVGCIATGKSRVAQLTADLKYTTGYTAEIDRPWSVTIDGNNTIFAGNFGTELTEFPEGVKPILQQLPFRSTGVTVMKSTSPGVYGKAHKLTLPTGGHEVMLANGFPLYGDIATYGHPNSRLLPITYNQPCYIPLMRITSSTIDGAGNLWVMNNWKPSATIDLKENPGGDGVVIFLGVARPAE
jgi:hypothetical protein